jgi:hypothetical protein
MGSRQGGAAGTAVMADFQTTSGGIFFDAPQTAFHQSLRC